MQTAKRRTQLPLYSHVYCLNLEMNISNNLRSFAMPKGYMISAHRSEANPSKRAAYLELAMPALKAAGGKPLSSGDCRVEARENGIVQRTVLIQFDSFEKAIAAYDSDAYQEALNALGDGADRDVRLFEGV